jgi:hypothetical protein
VKPMVKGLRFKSTQLSVHVAQHGSNIPWCKYSRERDSFVCRGGHFRNCMSWAMWFTVRIGQCMWDWDLVKFALIEYIFIIYRNVISSWVVYKLHDLSIYMLCNIVNFVVGMCNIQWTI